MMRNPKQKKEASPKNVKIDNGTARIAKFKNPDPPLEKQCFCESTILRLKSIPPISKAVDSTKHII
jgi:hypothetical protein